MDLSYAQHLEDYHLSLVFGGQAEGFYIDVGAGHPVADNASCWFYLKGWRGVVAEPQAELLSLYEHVRPRDIREGRVVAAAAGEAEFHVVDRLHGFSTTIRAFAESARDFGTGHATRRVKTTTLAAICAEHDVGAIDFLKIDVEGAEGDVLRGGDFARWRPRVIVCEAVAPGSMAPNWSDWQPFLLDRGYEFVLDEGLNRWYVAREDKDLLARFPREKAEWLAAPHLGHTNRAPFRDDHPDHAFARDFVGAFLAMAPRLDRAVLRGLLEHGERGDLDAPMSTEARAGIVARIFPGPRFAEASAGIDRIAAATRREFIAEIVESDAFRVMLGRMAASYDGGQILD